MAPHSSTLAWKIPWAEEPGGLQSMGSHRVGHDWSDLAAAAAVAAAAYVLGGEERELGRKTDWKTNGKIIPNLVKNKNVQTQETQ